MVDTADVDMTALAHTTPALVYARSFAACTSVACQRLRRRRVID